MALPKRMLMAGLLAASALIGCGDDPTSACRQMGAEICSRACECGTGGRCGFANGAGPGVIEWASRSDCDNYFGLCNLAGSQGDKTAMWLACAHDLQSAACVPASGTVTGYVERPASCN
jgi:hypothetical protein